MPHRLVLQNQGHGIGHGYYNQGHPNQYYQNQGHGMGHGHYNQGPQNYVDLNEIVMGHIKVEAPTFDGRLDQWVFTKWLHDIDHFFERYNLSENRRVRFAKMKLIGSAQLFWECRGTPH